VAGKDADMNRQEIARELVAVARELTAAPKYRVVNDEWGDPVRVTVRDVKEQARIFGLNPRKVTFDDEYIYYDEDVVAKK